MERPEIPPKSAVPYPQSLCHRCAERAYVRGRTTWFVKCAALPRKYPPQPVRVCPAFRPG